MSKLQTVALQSLMIAALSTVIAQAQVMNSPAPLPTATPSKSSIQWHNGRGPEYFLAGVHF
jgi:hypothetical protein